MIFNYLLFIKKIIYKTKNFFLEILINEIIYKNYY